MNHPRLGAALRAQIPDLARTDSRSIFASHLSSAAPALRPGAVIAQFSCGRDARLFAGLKRDAGELVTIDVGSSDLPYAVRLLVEARR